MSQAKVLTDREFRKVLSYIAIHKHAARNRAILMVTHLAGLRIMEAAALKIGDVWSDDGVAKSEIRLLRDQTKGKQARTVFLSEKLRKELIAYLATIDRSDLTKPLFYTQKREGFTANTLCQAVWWMFRKSGVSGASSHSGRRYFCTSLANKGVGVRTIMALSGHKALSSVQVYIDSNDEMNRRAVELI
jgi:integrase/recombinase XerD